MFTLPSLPYSYDALEPYVDTQTMELHHSKHHKTYIDNLNKALELHPKLQSLSIEELMLQVDSIPTEIRQTVINNGGGHYNHSLFWNWMMPKSSSHPAGAIGECIKKQFGSFDQFKIQFAEAGKQCFGSGWVWLIQGQSNALEIVHSTNQNNPLMKGIQPLLGLDVWEHAYYLHYQNRRIDYITAWWNVVNWDFVETLYKKNR